MLYLGKFNKLNALHKTAHGMFLGEADGNQKVLLPNKYVQDSLRVGDEIDVFLYTDSEDRLVATTATPKILLHRYAVLEVTDLANFGAFLDWGLDKDLLLPFSEQNGWVKKGDRVTVFLDFDDKTDRLVASAKIDEFIDPEVTVAVGEEVELLVERQSELGYQVIINDKHIGLVYSNEVFQPLLRGDRVTGYIKMIRDDGKIDVSLQKQGIERMSDDQEALLKKLKDNGGVLYLTDKSDPKLIARKVQLSKKAFKRSVGSLYKARKIAIEADRIVLCDDPL